MSTVSDLRMRRARAYPYAMACEDSRAGWIPSYRDSRSNPSSARSSVTETYVARLVSLSHACSGPTPG